MRGKKNQPVPRAPPPVREQTPTTAFRMDSNWDWTSGQPAALSGTSAQSQDSYFGAFGADGRCLVTLGSQMSTVGLQNHPYQQQQFQLEVFGGGGMQNIPTASTSGHYQNLQAVMPRSMQSMGVQQGRPVQAARVRSVHPAQSRPTAASGTPGRVRPGFVGSRFDYSPPCGLPGRRPPPPVYPSRLLPPHPGYLQRQQQHQFLPIPPGYQQTSPQSLMNSLPPAISGVEQYYPQGFVDSTPTPYWNQSLPLPTIVNQVQLSHSAPSAPSSIAEAMGRLDQRPVTFPRSAAAPVKPMLMFSGPAKTLPRTEPAEVVLLESDDESEQKTDLESDSSAESSDDANVAMKLAFDLSPMVIEKLTVDLMKTTSDSTSSDSDTSETTEPPATKRPKLAVAISQDDSQSWTLIKMDKQLAAQSVNSDEEVTTEFRGVVVPPVGSEDCDHTQVLPDVVENMGGVSNAELGIEVDPEIKEPEEIRSQTPVLMEIKIEELNPEMEDDTIAPAKLESGEKPQSPERGVHKQETEKPAEFTSEKPQSEVAEHCDLEENFNNQDTGTALLNVTIEDSKAIPDIKLEMVKEENESDDVLEADNDEERQIFQELMRRSGSRGSCSPTGSASPSSLFRDDEDRESTNSEDGTGYGGSISSTGSADPPTSSKYDDALKELSQKMNMSPHDFLTDVRGAGPPLNYAYFKDHWESESSSMKVRKLVISGPPNIATQMNVYLSESHGLAENILVQSLEELTTSRVKPADSTSFIHIVDCSTDDFTIEKLARELMCFTLAGISTKKVDVILWSSSSYRIPNYPKLCHLSYLSCKTGFALSPLYFDQPASFKSRCQQLIRRFEQRNPDRTKTV